MNTNTKRIAGVGIFAAIVVVLQLMATLINFGAFSITLVLVPIVIGAALYGIGAGAMLGAVFGIVVLVMTITGADPAAHMLWVANPVMTLLVILLRGISAGAAAGAVYRLLSRFNKFAAVLSAAVVAPIVNTGLFMVAMWLIFPDFLALWADGARPLTFLIIGLAGINFIIEMVINLVLSPTIVGIINAVKKVS